MEALSVSTRFLHLQVGTFIEAMMSSVSQARCPNFSAFGRGLSLRCFVVFYSTSHFCVSPLLGRDFH